MIVVIGRVRLLSAHLASAMELSLDHVQRSRTEPGCISHGVHVDVEDPQTLVFVERWSDRAALGAHFAVPASQEFVAALRPFAETDPTIDIYEVAPSDP